MQYNWLQKVLENTTLASPTTFLFAEQPPLCRRGSRSSPCAVSNQ